MSDIIHKKPQNDLAHFEAVYDVVYFIEQGYHKFQSGFCNMVLGHEMGCEMCCWEDLCDTIPSGDMAEKLESKYAEYLI